MVEVFKTNVKKQRQAKLLLKKLGQEFPTYLFNFDLEDCDKILRVEHPEGHINDEAIVSVFEDLGFHIEVLPDTIPVQHLMNSPS